jgi:hypothetical protein
MAATIGVPADEHDMTWSDSNRVEEDLRRTDAEPEPVANPHEFGSLGRALWRERSLERILRIRSRSGSKTLERSSQIFHPPRRRPEQSHDAMGSADRKI